MAGPQSELSSEFTFAWRRANEPLASWGLSTREVDANLNNASNTSEMNIHSEGNALTCHCGSGNFTTQCKPSK